MSLEESARALINLALQEDLPDATSVSIFGDAPPRVRGRMMCKEDGILCGMFIVPMVFAAIDPKVEVTLLAKDGDFVKKGQFVATVEGPAHSVLSGERTALNFVQRLSGVASKTNAFVKAIAHTKAKILDTRKTTPGYRVLEKYAVTTGGAVNHRRSLADMILIKDNHITAAGSITKAITKAREKYPALPIEVEVANMEQLTEALLPNPPLTRIMLDNMSPDMMRQAVKLTAGRVPLEASGGVNFNTVVAIAETGVDCISVGSITHSAAALDFNMKITNV